MRKVINETFPTPTISTLHRSATPFIPTAPMPSPRPIDLSLYVTAPRLSVPTAVALAIALLSAAPKPAPAASCMRSPTRRIVARSMRLSSSFSGALRTFAYFMASGTQNSLEGIDYLSLYGEEPSAIERVFAIYANVIELDEAGTVLNAKYAEKRATDSLRAYCDPTFVVTPPYADWELALHDPPPLRDRAPR